jgi:tRNA(Ile2) C34 agmatinyltransferase TiaS
MRLLAATAAAPLFPRVFPCPICEVKLRAGRAGRYRCSHCRTILALADTGAVDLG